MSNAVIYYRMTDKQNSAEVIKEISKVINNIHLDVAGVYIDLYNHIGEFSKLMSSDLSSTKTLYINNELTNEFDKKIIKELARSEGFTIEYFYEMK